jgi:ethanolamine ammonia-lyase small subunit
MTDPWDRLRLATRARIGLGRSGDALPTDALLDFQAAHARARDAVHAVADFSPIERTFAHHPVVKLHSAAKDRAVYLRRPDLGRQLDSVSRERLRLHARAGGWDIVFVVADGLSAAAVTAHAAPVLSYCLAGLSGLAVAPVMCAEQARVAIADEIGEAIGARLSVILIGERPGLSVADSLGLYLTWDPRIGRSDSERNCISNIHADGLTYARASDTAIWLINAALKRRLTGVRLKEASQDNLLTLDRARGIEPSS